MIPDLIRRRRAARYIENLLVAFALTLVGIRVFLAATGYPQLGAGMLHIAHVLWGGVLLLAAVVLALMYANAAALRWSAYLAGIGWAFFIDEVGKFITADADYFFRPAAPIIYLSFLSLWYLVIYVGRFPASDELTQFYHILDMLGEVVEARADPEEFELMRDQLLTLSRHTSDTFVDELAYDLLRFVDREEVHMREQTVSPFARWMIRIHQQTHPALLSPLVAYVLYPSALALYAVALSLYSITQALPLLFRGLAPILHADLVVDPFSSSENMLLFLALNVLRVGVAMRLLQAVSWSFRGKPKGPDRAHTALIVSITAVDLLVFYFRQFAAVPFVIVDVIFLYWNSFYRRHLL